jgi:hypothetical protein
MSPWLALWQEMVVEIEDGSIGHWLTWWRCTDGPFWPKVVLYLRCTQIWPYSFEGHPPKPFLCLIYSPVNLRSLPRFQPRMLSHRRETGYSWARTKLIRVAVFGLHWTSIIAANSLLLVVILLDLGFWTMAPQLFTSRFLRFSPESLILRAAAFYSRGPGLVCSPVDIFSWGISHNWGPHQTLWCEGRTDLPG